MNTYQERMEYTNKYMVGEGGIFGEYMVKVGGRISGAYMLEEDGMFAEYMQWKGWNVWCIYGREGWNIR